MKHKFDIQLFADPAPAPAPGLESIVADAMKQQEPAKQEPAKQEPKQDPAPNPADPAKLSKVEFTPEQQAYIDKLIGVKVKELKTKAEKDIEEAARLANMTAEDRIKEELKKANEEISVYKEEKLKTQFKLELTAKQLPAELADYINVLDADAAKKALDFFASYKDTVTKPLQDRIKELDGELKNANLRGPAPKAFGNKTVDGPVSLSDIISENVQKMKQ